MVSARHLAKKFGGIVALSDVTFEIPTGEFVFLTGPSGSGKTTLLRLLLRDIKPDNGELVVNQINLAKLLTKNLPLFRRDIGIVFQDFKLLSDLSVAENISLPLQVRNLKDIQISSAVKVALELVGLSDRSDLFPAQLSGGELQRVALARAIVAKPKLLLADEPTGNLDPNTAKSIIKLLLTIHRELKTTIVMATHNADIVNTNTNRVITLVGGKITRDNPKGKYE